MYLTKRILSARRMCRPSSPRAVGQSPIVRYIFASVTALALAVGLLHAQTRGVETTSLDRAADPCVDFYQFACGGWVAKNPVPADRRSWGRFQEVQDRNQQILKRILETPSADRDREKASTYYAACSDEQAIDARGLAPIQPELSRSAALASRAPIPSRVARLDPIVSKPPD